MAGIKGGNTKPERDLRAALHARGFRYRLHAKSIVGRPDLVFPKYRAVVFVHGCFWHRHEGCRYATTPATRPEFWEAKFAENVARDARVQAELLSLSWRVATVWECALKRRAEVCMIADQIALWLISVDAVIEVGA
ncbi:T/G mismatch-specific endonuclease [Devosia enhydra]|uniref:Very short patch repair endonuclease n=1 Tax=Devosia enhydra TaxID=665118 RepID=A0A1K2HTW2_9HYPH|nr:T/G mismatch-specific endonuclease [Devosia enhydra]